MVFFFNLKLCDFKLTDRYCGENVCPSETHRCVRQSYDLLERTIVLENGYKCEKIPVKVLERTDDKRS